MEAPQHKTLVLACGEITKKILFLTEYLEGAVQSISYDKGLTHVL